MKKLIYALFGCFIAFGAFADGDSTIDTVTSVRIPVTAITNVVSRDAGLKAAEKAIVDEFNTIIAKSSDGKISTNDMWNICKKTSRITGIQKLSECYERFVLPVLAEARIVIYFNSCLESVNMPNGTAHCVDDVFVKEYKVQKNGQAITKKSTKPYAQDVNVSSWTAYGFAMEYLRLQGLNPGVDVFCSPTHDGDWIKCVEIRNTNFYTFKFAGTNNANDSTITENLIKGICALNQAEFVDKGFKGVSGDGHMGLNINYDTDYGCWMTCDTDVIHRFGLRSSNVKKNTGDGLVGDYCKIESLSAIGDTGISVYSNEYSYMSYAFKEVQTVLEPSLIKLLEVYVKAQGISVESFKCDYGVRKYKASNVVAGTIVNTSDDDVLTCKINGKEVDFIFDDLFESKEKARDIGESGMKCLLMNRAYGGTASFDGKYCKGPTESQCAELGKQVSGGTYWDSDAGACVLNDAAAAQKMKTVLTIAGGAAFVAGLILLNGGGLIVVLLEVGGSVVFDLSFEGINRFYETRPNKLATEFVKAAHNCGLIGENESCSNKTCIKNVAEKYLATLNDVIGNDTDALNDDQLIFVDNVYGRMGDCLTDLEFKTAIQNSKVSVKDNIMSKAAIGLFGLGFFVSPSGAIAKLNKLPKVSKILKRINVEPIERISSTLNGERYYRIYTHGSGGGLKTSEIDEIVNGLKSQGLYVSSYTEQSGAQFIAFAEKDIFRPWENSPYNWYIVGRYVDDGRMLVKRLDNIWSWAPGAPKWEYKSATESGLGFGHYRVIVDENTLVLQNRLKSVGIDSEIIDTNKGWFLVIREENLTSAKLDRLEAEFYSNPPTMHGIVNVDAGLHVDNAVDAGSLLYEKRSMFDIIGTHAVGNLWSSQVNDLYRAIRKGSKWPVNNSDISDAIYALRTPKYGNLSYRAPTPSYNWEQRVVSWDDARYHVSLNVNVNADLVRRLDDVMASDGGRNILMYKMPSVGSREWSSRADPITIYMRDTNPSLEQKIADAVRPYVRSADEGLLGRKIADGITIATETGDPMGMYIVNNIIDHVRKKDPGLAQQMSGRYSVGQTEALRIWASDFVGYDIPAQF